ncbi:putative aminopeptidase NPEPL1-like protein [Hyaloraphidium curvatum]|nr:putative aminopeptidase NPEPL1-like protein [Hyaloraphidium curvatum]
MPPTTNLRYVSAGDSSVASAKCRVILAERSLLDASSADIVASAAGTLPGSAEPFLDGSVDSLTLFGPGKKGERAQVTLAAFSAERSRHLGVVRGDAITDAVSRLVPKAGDASVTLILESESQAFAAGIAVARGLPQFSRKTTSAAPDRTVTVNIVTRDGKAADLGRIERVANAIRFCARLVDTPAGDLHTEAYQAEVEAVAAELAPKGVTLTIIKGEELEKQGYGGLWNVGKASEHPPVFCVLKYTPAGATKTTAFVGKGVVFDTGGLDIKTKEYMGGMKDDMGGSGACLAAFAALVRGSYSQNLACVMAIVENSVDSKSYRPDDIIKLKSGLTVEINNTDAEGRLILGDAVAFASGELEPKPDYILDLATLTGAQSYATGLKHAGLLTKDEELESQVVACGKRSGDLVFPLIYCPELLGIDRQFGSEIADMKNSVKDRGNAASSCAGHFIEAHFSKDWKGKWGHLDIAAPASLTGHSGDRASGYGVALLVEFAESVAKA